MTNRDDLLCAVLDCQIGDLAAIDDVEYDLFDIITNVKSNTDKITINSILAEVIYKGVADLTEAVKLRVQDLEAADELDEDESEELRIIKNLDPDEDTDWFINFTDTSVYLDNYNVYYKYFEDDMATIETNMGIDFEDTGEENV